MEKLNNFVVIVPAAGESNRFKKKGIYIPKPLIKFSWDEGRRKTMLEHSLSGVERLPRVIGTRTENVSIFKNEFPGSEIIGLNKTIGQADTVLQVLQKTNIDNPVLIVNSDQMFTYPLTTFAEQSNGFAASVLVFDGQDNEAYSYVDDFPIFEKAVEKAPISQWAIAGAFFFNSSKDLLAALIEQRTLCQPIGKETYLSETMNFISGQKLAISMPKEQRIGWGVPEELFADEKVTNLSL